MEHLDFNLFSDPVNKKFQDFASNSSIVLARANVSGDELYARYLAAYPTEMNTRFRERNHYDGNYDKNYIRRLGNLVAINEKGEVDTIWNVKVPGYFQQVADALHLEVLSAPLETVFVSSEPQAGSKPNKDPNADIIWTHFYSPIPKAYIANKDSVGATTGQFQNNLGVFTRGLVELNKTSLETVLELIVANSLYRGTEHKASVENFLKLKNQVDESENAQALRFYLTKKLGGGVCFKNTVIGTLVSDLSEGVELEKAVASFEKKVAGENYKRPKALALVTPRMIEEAQNKIEELGLTSALERRFATVKDLPVENVLFTSQNTKALSVFDDLTADAEATVKAQALAKVEEISLDHFVTNVLPSAKSVEVLFENKHTNNLVSLLTSVDPEAPHLFKWDNNFSWSYNGEVADSLRDQVAALGGRVDGVLRFSHSWNHDGQNQSLMDLHVFGPDCNLKDYGNNEEIHDAYAPSGRTRVGWNNRKCSITGGNQDVDFTSPPEKNVPVENITFPNLKKMPEGKYTLKVHNWSARSPNTSGFKAEVEFDGNIFNYEYVRSLKNKQWITVAEVTLKDGKFTIEHKMSNEASSKNVWGLDTNKWVKVNNILLSPNAWGDVTKGNEHLFFIIDACRTDQPARGIYNEFLRPEFEPNRKVFELLGSKTKAAPSEEQASGLGFSSTRRDKVTVRVKGKTQRTFIINL